jgi:hypothetical protein
MDIGKRANAFFLKPASRPSLPYGISVVFMAISEIAEKARNERTR